MSKQEDVLIIGGGVIGVCSAYYLSQQGRPVTLVEKGDICSGSSYGNAGLIVPSHAIPLAGPGVLRQGLRWLLDPESPLYVKPRPDPELARWLWQFRAACGEQQMHQTISVLMSLNQAGITLFEELAAIAGQDFGYERLGGLYLFNTQTGFDAGLEEVELLRGLGITPQVLDAEGVRQMVPNVQPSVVGGTYYPEDAHLIPDRLVHALARLAQDQGACLRTSTEVLGFETAGRRITAVGTTRGTFKPDQVVLAAGAWSPVLARSLGLNLPIQPAKGYSLTFKRPPVCPRVPLHLTERKVAVTPMGDMLRFGGTLELAGLDLSINQRRVAAIQQAAGEYLRGVAELELLEIWRGLRPLTPDTLPIIGRSRRFDNLIIATGHGMLGMSLGPITGKLVAQIAGDETPAVDLTPLRVDRFS